MDRHGYVLINTEQELGAMAGYGDVPLINSALGEEMRIQPARLLRKQQRVLYVLLRDGRIRRSEVFKHLGEDYNVPDFGLVMLQCGGYIKEEGRYLYLSGSIDVTKIKTRNESPYLPELLTWFRRHKVPTTSAALLSKNKVKAGGKTVKCSVNGIKFETLTLAAKHLGITSGTVKRRCQSVKWGQYRLE